MPDQDTTNFTSQQANGHMATEGIYDVDDFSWNVDGDWDAGNVPTNIPNQPPGLYPRDDLEDLFLYGDVADNTPWTFDYARVRSAKNGVEVRGMVSFSASGMNQGLVIVP